MQIINNLNSTQRGMAYMLFASFLFANMGAFAKELSHSMSSLEVVFFRNIFGVVIISYSIYKLPLIQVGGRLYLLVFRGVIGFLALLMFFYNIAHISLAEAMTFSKISPIFTALFAYLFLSEKLSVVGWGGVIIGFIGILFITQPNINGMSKSDYLGVLSGVGAALAYTSIRELKNYYDIRAIVFSFMFIGTLGPIILMGISELYISTTYDFILSKFIMPSSGDWIYIIALGLFSTYAQVFMTKAYSLTKAGVIGTIGYMSIVFSIFIDLFLSEYLPDIYISIGIILIILSGIIIAKKG